MGERSVPNRAREHTFLRRGPQLGEDAKSHGSETTELLPEPCGERLSPSLVSSFVLTKLSELRRRDSSFAFPPSDVDRS